MATASEAQSVPEVAALPPRVERLAGAVLLSILAAQLGWGVRADGLTIDEVCYVGAGYRHATALDYRLNPEQPPVAKLLGGLSLALLRPRVGPEDPAATGEWSWGYLLIHTWNDAQRVITWARVPIALVTLLLAAGLWAWSRSLHGPAAGLAALAVVAFHPSLAAHGHLLTTDLAGGATMALASWAFWRWSEAPSPSRAVVVGVCLGLAAGTRLTNWLLVPSFALLELLRLGRLRRRERPQALGQFAALAGITLAAVWLVLWALYGFRYAPWPGASVAQDPGEWLGLGGRVVAWLERFRLLPEAYLEGARFVLAHNAGGHPTYLLGETSNAGWRHYYLVAFLAKNTPGFLFAAAIAAVLIARRRWGAIASASVEAHWIVPAAAMFLAASFGRIQIGERYILPIYPYLALLIASAVPPLLARRRGRVVLAALLAAHALPTLAQQPRGLLSYFNIFAGGADGGHRVLADSNLDWGQDLPRLARWMRKTGVEEVQLGYHGSDNPDRHGIRHQDLPGMLLYATHNSQRPVQGVVAVSPNLLLGIFYGPGQNPYEALRRRPPDDRAGVYFIYRVQGGEIP